MKWNSKGQITIFIIMGILIFVSISFILYTNSLSNQRVDSETEKTFETPTDVIPIKNFIESCLENVAKKGLIFNSFQGGYYNTNPPFFDYYSIEVPYYFHLGSKHFPSKENIQKELSNSIKLNMPFCINDFELFNKQGYNITAGEINIDTKIVPKKVIINMEYPIKVVKRKSTTSLDSFNREIYFDFDKIYNLINQLIVEHDKYPDSIPLGYLLDLSDIYNFTFELTNLESNTVLYTLIFNKTNSFLDSYVFAFAVKYNWSDLDIPTNTNIVLSNSALKAYVGYEFNYQIKSNNTKVLFTDFTDLFDINKTTGYIRFTPRVKDAGKHNITILASHENGKVDKILLILDIIDDNNPPKIRNIDDTKLHIGDVFNKYINATDLDNDTIFYSIESSLDNFAVNILTGEMRFTPLLYQEGEYTITVIATDINGRQDKITFNMEIKNE